MIHDLFSILAQATPTQGADAPPPNPLGMILMPLCLIVIFYFLMVRPQQKRQKEQQAMVAGVKIGDEVIMTDGMHGIVANVKDSTIVLKVADNVKIEFDKVAIATIKKS